VWPADGIYCIATPFVIPNSDPPKKVYAHKTFNDVSDAISFVLNERNKKDLFFAIHTLKEHQVWDPNKINLKTGEVGSNTVRTQSNVKAARCFFFDLDVGPEVKKYQGQTEAAAALRKFCETTGLPKPLITSSGTGLHVYWIIVDALESNEWRNHAMKLKQLAWHHGLKVDDSRTTDTASVLRVAGTFNLKDRANPREVKVLWPLEGPAPATGAGQFIAMLDKAMIEAGVEAKTVPQVPQFGATIGAELGSNTVREYDGVPVSFEALLKSCGQMARLALTARAKKPISEPEWYSGVIGVGRFVEDGHRRIMQFGDPAWHPTIRDKIKQSEQHQSGPTSCAKLLEVSGPANEHICIACPFKTQVEEGKIHGPISAARYKDPAPAPVVQQLLDGGDSEPVVVVIPDPPHPFIRLKGGGIAVSAKNADGDELHTTIYDHDLYPIRRMSNPLQQLEQQVWHVELPLGEAKDFTLDADMLYDPRKFSSAIANQGIYPHKSFIPSVQEYMVAYISKLQTMVTADSQCNHLGWSDDFNSFIFPDKVINVDGTIKSTQLSLGAQRASVHVHKKGTAQRQAELLRFYDSPDYRAHQFFILASLAAPIFYATGQHGVIVNASGESGASKSTSLYAASSFWGQPELYPINGTNNGATIRGRNERVTVLANLPVGVDEITHMPVKDAIDLAMSITQPGHRIRLDTTGTERAHLGSYKSTIMLTTANNSLHGMLSTDNAAGTAGSMRVFEIRFPIPHVHKKQDADDFLFNLNQNYGHMGELFVRYVLTNRDAVVARVRAVMAQVDVELNVQASERFWSATIAAVLVTCEIANQLGILSWSPAEIKQWAYEKQVPQMRGIVKEEYRDPLGILSDFLETVSSNMIVIDESTGAVGAGTYVARKPMGALLAHYDKPDQMLYVLKTGFKDYCARIGANSLKILDDLNAMEDGQRIVPSKHTRRTLGAGTEYAKGQSYVFSVNMAHTKVSGIIDLEVLTGGGEQGAPTAKPGLQLVQ
jgi:hypothetical protein